ncbi:MAG: transglutaminase domain-containing protein [Ignavibacteriales bacterium]
MGIYSGGDRIGYSHTLIEPTNQNTKVSEETKLRMTIMGNNQDIEVKSNYLLNKYDIQSFDFSMKAGLVELQAEGKKEGNELKVQISSASGKSEVSFPLTDEPLVPSMLFKWLADQNPKVGKRYEVSLFDPTLVLTGGEAQSLKATLTVEGEEEVKIPLGNFKTYRVNMVFMGSESTSWITQDGEIIKEASPPGLVSVRETRDKALGESLSSLDIIQKTAISSNVLLDNPRTLKLLRVKIDGIDSTQGLDLNGEGGQSFTNGLIEVRQTDISGFTPYSLPYSGGEYKIYTKANSLIQSDDPRIVEKSREILKGEKNSLRAAEEISSWVYNNLEKVPTVSIPNALDVLKTKRGDCNEHATLFAALARAVGIPTKIAFGVVYLDGKFYYHAWDEVFVGRWLAVDPTFGQFPADASHIRFLEGDLSRGSEIIRLVGKIKIEIRGAS